MQSLVYAERTLEEPPHIDRPTLFQISTKTLVFVEKLTILFRVSTKTPVFVEKLTIFKRKSI